MNQLLIIAQYFLIAGWIGVLLIMYINKRSYFRPSIKVLMLLVSLGMVSLEVTYINHDIGVATHLDVLRFSMRSLALILIYKFIKSSEFYINMVMNYEDMLNVSKGYQKIYDSLPIVVWATRLSDGVLVFTNKEFKKRIEGDIGMDNESQYGHDLAHKWDITNLQAKQAKGVPVKVTDPFPHGGEWEVLKLYLIIDKVEYVFGIEVIKNKEHENN